MARKKRIQQSENDLRQRAQYDEKAKAILQKRKDKELVNVLGCLYVSFLGKECRYWCGCKEEQRLLQVYSVL